MPARSRKTPPRSLRTLFNLGTIGELTDGQLLERFATRDGESAELAFAALVERHGPMVLRACRSILGPDDANDAFQATFLVLSRRCGSLWVRDSIGPWLHAVALRVSRRARSADALRRRHERQSAELSPRRTFDPPSDLDPLERALHDEIERLPPRERDPIVLIDLQGRSYEQAARHLGLPVGTLKSRLTRGRDRLRDRLRRRGFAPTTVVPVSPAAPVLPGSFIDATSSAALRAAAGLATAGTVPASVLMLASGALWMIRLTSLIRWSAAALALALAGAGLAAGAGLLPGQEPRPPARADDPSPLPAPAGAPRQDVGPMISYQVKIIDVPGLAFHATGFDLDFFHEPPTGLAFLSELEETLLIDTLEAIPGTSITRAPTVTTLPGAGATITSGPGAPALSDRVPAISSLDRPIDGWAIQLQGRPSGDGRHLSMHLDLRDVHVVAVHAVDVPAADRSRPDREIEVPEVVRTRFDQSVTIPAKGAGVLVSLGPRRIVDDHGESSLSERLILLRARPIRSTVGMPRPSLPLPPAE